MHGFPWWFSFLVHPATYIVLAVLLIAAVIGVVYALKRRRVAPEAKAAGQVYTPKERARAFLPWAIALCGGIIVWVLWPSDASGAAPLLSPLPDPHASCGDAPLTVHNEDTGELFPAIAVRYSWQGDVRIVSFHDARLYCDGYEGDA